MAESVIIPALPIITVPPAVVEMVGLAGLTTTGSSVAPVDVGAFRVSPL